MLRNGMAPIKNILLGKTFNTPIGDIVITPNLDSSNRYLHQKFQVKHITNFCLLLL